MNKKLRNILILITGLVLGLLCWSCESEKPVNCVIKHKRPFCFLYKDSFAYKSPYLNEHRFFLLEKIDTCNMIYYASPQSKFKVNISDAIIKCRTNNK